MNINKQFCLPDIPASPLLRESAKDARLRRATEEMAANDEAEREEKRKKRLDEKKKFTGTLCPKPKRTSKPPLEMPEFLK